MGHTYYACGGVQLGLAPFINGQDETGKEDDAKYYPGYAV